MLCVCVRACVCRVSTCLLCSGSGMELVAVEHVHGSSMYNGHNWPSYCIVIEIRGMQGCERYIYLGLY